MLANVSEVAQTLVQNVFAELIAVVGTGSARHASLTCLQSLVGKVNQTLLWIGLLWVVVLKGVLLVLSSLVRCWGIAMTANLKCVSHRYEHRARARKAAYWSVDRWAT